jgi:uncharacterized protein YkwD
VLISANSISQELQTKNYYLKLNLNNFRKEELFHEQINFDSIDYSRLHAVIFFVTNEERAKKNLSYLEYAPELERTAQMHSKDMAEKNFFSHTNPSNRKKRTPNDRAALAGILNPYLAENIAQSFGLQYKSEEKVFIRGDGQFSYRIDSELIPPHTFLTLAESIVNGWMNSKGHRQNILSDNALQLGCGAYFYRDKDFNNMPAFTVTQNFQWYKKIKSQ